MIDENERTAEETVRKALDPFHWVRQIAEMFGTKVKYRRRAGQLRGVRPRDEQYRRYGAAIRKRERRQVRNAHTPGLRHVGQLGPPSPELIFARQVNQERARQAAKAREKRKAEADAG